MIGAVTKHMNGDHPEDNLLIVRAFGAPGASESTMIGLDSSAGVWRVIDELGEREVRVEWPGGPISERPEIRREVVVLYNAACEKLGLPAREEHAPAAGRSSGGYHHAAPEEDGSFSHAIRAATWGDHGDSEGATVMEDIMRMRGTIEDYTDLVAQHYFMYRALEDASKLLAADERFVTLHPAALVREQALIEDLELLLGTEWRERIEAVPATIAYAERIREVAAEGWLAGIIAHHYTRYLGDLSGGQMIAKRVKKQHGFDRAGVAFYDFSELGGISEYKQSYREVLDSFGERLDETERQRMIDEVRLAYRFNTEIFVELDARRNEGAERAVAS